MIDGDRVEILALAVWARGGQAPLRAQAVMLSGVALSCRSAAGRPTLGRFPPVATQALRPSRSVAAVCAATLVAAQGDGLDAL